MYMIKSTKKTRIFELILTINTAYVKNRFIDEGLYSSIGLYYAWNGDGNSRWGKKIKKIVRGK